MSAVGPGWEGHPEDRPAGYIDQADRRPPLEAAEAAGHPSALTADTVERCAAHAGLLRCVHNAGHPGDHLATVTW